MELSIIVPVYNVERFLDKCLDSLIHQTLTNNRYEIIIVNDGSTDHSQEIIDCYDKEYTNIRAFKKVNGGLSDARNYGIQKAKGDYIAFVDSDDYVNVNMYEQLLKKTMEYPFDMIVCDFIEVYDDKKVICTSRLKNDILSINELKSAMLDIYPSAWNKIYKRSLFDHIQFKKGVWFEDVECLYRMFPYLHHIGVVHEPLYYYVQRHNSISKSKDTRIYHCIENWNGIVDYYQNQHNQQFLKEIEYCYVRYLYATFIKAAQKFDKVEFDRAVQVAKKNVKQFFPKYRHNPYFYRSLKGIYLLTFNRYYTRALYRMKKG